MEIFRDIPEHNPFKTILYGGGFLTFGMNIFVHYRHDTISIIVSRSFHFFMTSTQRASCIVETALLNSAMHCLGQAWNPIQEDRERSSASTDWSSIPISRISATVPSPRIVAPEIPLTSRYILPSVLMTV